MEDFSFSVTAVHALCVVNTWKKILFSIDEPHSMRCVQVVLLGILRQRWGGWWWKSFGPLEQRRCQLYHKLSDNTKPNSRAINVKDTAPARYFSSFIQLSAFVESPINPTPWHLIECGPSMKKKIIDGSHTVHGRPCKFLHVHVNFFDVSIRITPSRLLPPFL